MRFLHTKNLPDERGMIATELSLFTALLLMPLIAGTITLSSYIHVRHILSRAVHEGCMAAVIGLDVVPAIEAHLAAAGLELSYADISTTRTGEGVGADMTVSITYNLQDTLVFPFPDIPQLENIQVEGTVRALLDRQG